MINGLSVNVVFSLHKNKSTKTMKNVNKTRCLFASEIGFIISDNVNSFSQKAEEIHNLYFQLSVQWVCQTNPLQDHMHLLQAAINHSRLATPEKSTKVASVVAYAPQKHLTSQKWQNLLMTHYSNTSYTTHTMSCTTSSLNGANLYITSDQDITICN